MKVLIYVAAILALSPASATAGSANKGQISDAQMACAAAATKDFLTTNAALLIRGTVATGLMSVDDKIAQRRLLEGYCKQWAACLVSNMDANNREIGYRATFSACLDADANEQNDGRPSEAR
jgi:hypothetical protein